MAILEKLVVQDYRNIALAELEFSANINCISGGNGEGRKFDTYFSQLFHQRGLPPLFFVKLNSYLCSYI